MRCWKCNSEQKSLPDGKLPFRSTCEQCDFYLHSCKNCKYYKPGLPNDCMVPGTEPVRDRESFNYCEEFAWNESISEKSSSIEDAAKKLFGDDDESESGGSPKDKFHSLFDD